MLWYDILYLYLCKYLLKVYFSLLKTWVRFCCYRFLFCKQIFYEWISLNLQSIMMWNYNVQIRRAVAEKNNNFFACKIFFWCSIILLLSTQNTFLCYINFFFLLTWNIFSCSINTFFSKPKYFLCKSNFLFQHKIIFRATSNFCFGYLLECYVMVIYFYCHIATKL